MLAILYLVAATCFGDLICRRVFRFISLQQRLATSFLVGLLFSTWITFLAAVVFHGSRQPLVLGNLVFLIVLGGTGFLNWRFPPRDEDGPRHRSAGSNQWDLVWL